MCPFRNDTSALFKSVSYAIKKEKKVALAEKPKFLTGELTRILIM